MADISNLGANALAVELGRKIEADRKAKGYTQKDLAAGLELTQAAVCRWESGDNYPTIGNLRRLANVFGWDQDTFLRFALREETAA